MDGNVMGVAVATAVKDMFDSLSTSEINDLDPEVLWKVICNEIVSHIQNQATISGVDSNGDTHNLLTIS
jgi:hypothetical protein